MKRKPIRCRFNMDTVCVEATYLDGSKLSINCDAVETEYARNIYEQSELDYLIYNAPVEYMSLVLSGEIENYLRKYTDYSPLP